MTIKVRTTSIFVFENSIHAAEQLGNPGGSQHVSELVRRMSWDLSVVN